MATLRERYPARDGMGHANRPRRHDALGLDAQPRRLCLSSCWSRHANTNTNRNSYGYGNSNSQCDTNSNSHTYCKDNSDAETSPDASAAPVSVASKVIGDQ